MPVKYFILGLHAKRRVGLCIKCICLCLISNKEGRTVKSMKNTSVLGFIKIRTGVLKLLHADRWKDIHRELN